MQYSIDVNVLQSEVSDLSSELDTLKEKIEQRMKFLESNDRLRKIFDDWYQDQLTRYDKAKYNMNLGFFRTVFGGSLTTFEKIDIFEDKDEVEKLKSLMRNGVDVDNSGVEVEVSFLDFDWAGDYYGIRTQYDDVLVQVTPVWLYALYDHYNFINDAFNMLQKQFHFEDIMGDVNNVIISEEDSRIIEKVKYIIRDAENALKEIEKGS